MSTTSQEKKLVTLKSSDKEEFVVEESIAVTSETIKNIIEDVGLELIPLPNVDGKTLAKVIEYCTKHSTGSNDDSEDIKKFDDEFLDSNQIQVLFDMVLAANYLNIKSLLEKVCTKIADRIKDMSVEEVREVFKIENDFTPEEEKKIRDEHAWAHE
ncbi:hypothetical protein LguiB_013964 [Lonicera macranthoides]